MLRVCEVGVELRSLQGSNSSSIEARLAEREGEGVFNFDLDVVLNCQYKHFETGWYWTSSPLARAEIHSNSVDVFEICLQPFNFKLQHLALEKGRVRNTHLYQT
jgi:hypothetical protein